MPSAARRGFVLIKTEMHGERYRVDGVGQAEFARRVIGRVGADDDQRFDAAGVNVADQIAQRLRMPHGHRIDRRDVIDWRIELRH